MNATERLSVGMVWKQVTVRCFLLVLLMDNFLKIKGGRSSWWTLIHMKVQTLFDSYFLPRNPYGKMNLWLKG
ncbi:hypothetical protein [Paraliobacillus quinghaiensis]|uniref:hypothetical protein n=1 Tax=Paraliobacillus quinghaiensis TaxID=470815 RepID=UPI000E3C697D|nr:hypothetical protein [Paraliobacillus quinghaiensis]